MFSRKVVGSAIVSLVAVFGLQLPPSLTPYTPVTEKVECRDANFQPLGHGSAVVVGPNLLLTAKHVAEGCSEVGGSLFLFTSPLTTKRLAPNADLALLESPRRFSSWAQVAEAAPVRGTEITVLGWPGMFSMEILTKGAVAGYADLAPYGDDRKMVMMLAIVAATFGNSGGGAFNASGELVGILSGFMWQPGRSPYSMTLLVPVEDIKEILEER